MEFSVSSIHRSVSSHRTASFAERDTQTGVPPLTVNGNATTRPADGKTVNNSDGAHGITPRPTGPVLPTDSLTNEQSDIVANIKATISGDAQGNVHEEEFQYALVVHLLADNPEAQAAYQAAFTQLIFHASAEDAVKEALKKVVDQGLLTIDEAEAINGTSFRAAQLDENLAMLFDDRGSGSDPTIAVMNIDDAIARASDALEKIKAGEISVEARSLDAPSNGPGGISSSGAQQYGDGFLWKPNSERDGNLVVLFPPALSGQIQSAGIYTEVPPTAGSLIESGRFSGDTHNGGRAHFRFTRPGGVYADGVYVVAQLRDGSYVQFQIGETSQRNE